MQTVIAVKEFQRASGITASGMANPQTRAALLANDAVVNTQTTLVEGSSGVAVENLQKDLAALKIYTGEIDGVFDAEVSDAVSRFQRIYHYTVTGQADADLQARVAERVAELEQQYGEDGYDVTFEQVVTEKARVVGIKTLYMLSEPSLDSQVLVGMPLGNELTVLERGDEWSKISYNGYEGYTLTCYMSIYSEEVEEAHYTARPEPDPTPEPVYTVQPELMARVRVQRGMLSLRKAPDEEATVVAKVADGTELKVLARGEEWTQLEYAGKSVYAQTENLRFFTRYNQVIDESSGATDSVEGAQTAGTTPEGTTPADQEPTGTTPADQEPAGTTPADQEPTETTPADQEPTGTTPADQEPAETTPADQEPAETTPADQEPTGTTPVDQGKDVVAQASPQSSEGVQAQSNGAAPTAQTQEGQNAPTAQTCEQGVSEPVAQQSPSAVPAEGT